MNQRSIHVQLKLFRILIWSLPVLLFLQDTDAAEPTDKLPAVFAGKVDYQQDILPILKQHCLGCHGAAKQESGLRLDSPASLLRGGDLGEAAVLPPRQGLAAAPHQQQDHRKAAQRGPVDHLRPFVPACFPVRPAACGCWPHGAR